MTHLALVTGASRGIGKEIALALVGAGHKVIAVSKSGANISESVISLKCDVADRKAVDALAKEVKANYGEVDILVNAAGVFGPIDLIQDADPDEYVETIMIDALAPYFTSRVFLSGMLEKKWGRIINLSSAAALHPPGKLNSAYATAKVALNQFTRHLAAEIAGSGVTANVIHPGDVKSDMWADISKKADELGEAGADYKAWVDWVAKTGGDDPKKAGELILKLIEDAKTNGMFCWIDAPLQAPIPSWDQPSDERPWID